MLSVHARLTLVMIALIAAVVAALSVVENVRLVQFLVDSEAVRVRAQAKDAIDLAATGSFDAAAAQTLATALTSADTGAVVLAPDGSVLGRPVHSALGRSAPTDVPVASLRRALAGDLHVDVVRAGTGGRELLVLVPEPGGQPTRAVVVLSVSLERADAVAHRQLAFSALAVLVVLAAVAVVSPLLVRRSLRPLSGIAAAAADVAGGRFDRRLRWRGPPDQIGALSEAFDTMTDALQRAFADLAALERRSRQFVADASHELRTPLTTVGGFTDLILRLGDDATDGDRTRLLAGLRREVGRMDRLVSDLLQLASAEGGTGVTPVDTDVRALAGVVADQVGLTTDDHRVEVAPGPPVVCRTVPDRVHRILLNLIANAVQHSPGGATVRVSAHVDDAGGTELVVADDGPGMDADLLRRAFERFGRGPGPARGTGLGLPIVAALTASLGGTVELTSAPGVGTTARLRLPAVAPEPAAGLHPPDVRQLQGR